MHLIAVGDKTLIKHPGGIFPPSEAVLNINIVDLKKGLDKKNNTYAAIQTIFPELSDDERKFLITGCPIGSGHWDELFNENDY